MIPAYTNEYWRPRCQCVRAALASILAIAISTIPQYRDDVSPEECWDVLQKWAGDHNAIFICLASAETVPSYHLGWVKLKQDEGKGLFNGLHAVVVRDGKIVHDPHGDQSAHECELRQVDVISPLDPAKRMTFWNADEAIATAMRRRLFYCARSQQRRRFIRGIHRKRAENRFVNRVLRRWALVDAEECVE